MLTESKRTIHFVSFILFSSLFTGFFYIDYLCYESCENFSILYGSNGFHDVGKWSSTVALSFAPDSSACKSLLNRNLFVFSNRIESGILELKWQFWLQDTPPVVSVWTVNFLILWGLVYSQLGRWFSSFILISSPQLTNVLSSVGIWRTTTHFPLCNSGCQLYPILKVFSDVVPSPPTWQLPQFLYGWEWHT